MVSIPACDGYLVVSVNLRTSDFVLHARTIQSYESRTLVCRMSHLRIRRSIRIGIPKQERNDQSILINNSGTLEWIERTKSLVIDSLRAA
jgi:hypothetical protein